MYELLPWPESWLGSLHIYLLSLPRFWTLSLESTERFWFLFWSILNCMTLKTRNSNQQCHPLQFLTVMTSLQISSPPTSILHRLFRCTYSNSWDMTASFASFFVPQPERPGEPVGRLYPARSVLLNAQIDHTTYLAVGFGFFLKIGKVKGSLLIKAKSCAEGSNSGECTQS